MSELPPDDSQESEPIASKPTLSRRQLLKRLGIGGVTVVGLSVGGGIAAKDIFEWYENNKGRSRTEDIFENDGLYNWRKLTVVPALVQIDPSVKVSSGMFKSPNTTLGCPPGGFIVAQQPIAVRNTILRNIADYGSGDQSEMDRALPSIPPGLIAFYAPGPGNFVYLDADSNQGLITPITDGGIVGNHLGISDLDINGREVRGNVAYPYTSQDEVQYPQGYFNNPNNTNYGTQQPKAVESYQFIGQSMVVNSDVQLNEVASNLFYQNEWPIQFPSA